MAVTKPRTRPRNPTPPPGTPVIVRGFEAKQQSTLSQLLRLREKTFPVALSEEGVLVDHPDGKYEIQWSDVLGAAEERSFSRHYRGFNLRLRFRRGPAEESLHLGFKRVVNGIPLELFKVKARVTAGYGEAITYLKAKGVKVDIATSKLAEQFVKVQAAGRVKVVRH